jgi:hypothetical protein
MNTPVSFEIKQLLYDKGWRYELGVDETGYRVEHSLAEQRWNEGDLTYVDITISDVVMWLYEKHEYWCYSYTNGKIWYPCIQHKFGDMAILSGKIGTFNSPTEAYEAAINYTLNNLI